MLRSTPRVSAACTLVALALTASPALAHAKGTRSSGQGRAAASSGKTVVPSQLLVVKTKPAKAFAKSQASVALNENNTKPAAADRKLPGQKLINHMPRRRSPTGSWMQNYSGDSSDISSADGSNDSTASETDQTVDSVASSADAN